MQVKFITRDNEIFEMDYTEVNDFCKNICLSEEYKSEFDKFKVNYTVFDPYFDFVTFKLKYIFCAGIYTLAYYSMPGTQEEGLYDAAISTGNYAEVMKSLDNMRALNIDYFPVIKISKCSDRALNIELLKEVPNGSYLVDENLVGYISKVCDEQGSHLVTADTILNQYLIRDKNILRSLINYKNVNGFSDGTGLNYMEEVLGYMRMSHNSLTFNGVALSKKQLDFMQKVKDADYIAEDRDADVNYGNIDDGRRVKKG